MNIDEQLDRVVEIEHQLAALQSEQARLVAAIADRPCEGEVDKEWFKEELRALLGESRPTVDDRVETARMLVHRLPMTLSALERGQLTMRHVHSLVTAVVALPAKDVAAIEASCVPFASGKDYTAFTRKVRRAVVGLDSRAVEERFRAALADRRVWAVPNEVTTTFGAVLPADGAQVVLKAIDCAADRVPKDDPRTRDQRRADGLVQIAEDYLGSVVSNDTVKRHGPAVQITIAASTLLGVDNHPGELAGHGLIPAAVARAIAADPSGTWRRLITDDQGRLVDYGRTTYRPPTALTDFVRARDKECRFPGCHRQARFCELDHVVPWSDGGTTKADNLICLCSRHHHAKHEAGWTSHEPTPGCGGPHHTVAASMSPTLRLSFRTTTTNHRWSPTADRFLH